MADPAKYSDDWRANGPPGGDVRSLVVDPSNPDRFYLGTLDAQLYTSADGGKSWELLYNSTSPNFSWITSLSTRVTQKRSTSRHIDTRIPVASSNRLTAAAVGAKSRVEE